MQLEPSASAAQVSRLRHEKLAAQDNAAQNEKPASCAIAGRGVKLADALGTAGQAKFAQSPFAVW